MSDILHSLLRHRAFMNEAHLKGLSGQVETVKIRNARFISQPMGDML